MSEAREQFEAWRDTMESSLVAFRRDLPPDVAEQLDDSPESLDALEAWLLDRYAGPEELRPHEERHTVDGAARYVGEIFRRELDGRWDLQEEEAAPRVPLLCDVGMAGTPPVIPLFAVNAATDRRTGHFLSDMLKALRAERLS